MFQVGNDFLRIVNREGRLCHETDPGLRWNIQFSGFFKRVNDVNFPFGRNLSDRPDNFRMILFADNDNFNIFILKATDFPVNFFNQRAGGVYGCQSPGGSFFRHFLADAVSRKDHRAAAVGLIEFFNENGAFSR